MSILDNTEFVSQHANSAKEYYKAKMRLVEGEATDTLVGVRNSLETLLHNLCMSLNMEMSDEEGKSLDMFELIDHLKDDQVITPEEANILHKTRKLGNRGHHPGDTPPSLEEAREGVDLLDSALVILYDKFDKSNVTEPSGTAGSPKYYDLRRKYRGDWAYFYSREKLFENEDYANLSLRAENGEVDAMLDLAIGFLPKNPLWGKEQLVCMPKYYDRRTDREYYNDEYDAPDTRYYHWIIRASNRMAEDGVTIKDSHKKYAATALFEAIKFLTHVQLGMASGNYISSVRDGCCSYRIPIELSEQMFGRISVNPIGWTRKLEVLVDEAGTFDCIDPLHQHNRSGEGINYLIACRCYAEKEEFTIESFDEDGNRHIRAFPVTVEYLERTRPRDGGGDLYYSWIVNQINQAAAEEEARAKAEAEEKLMEEQRQKEAEALQAQQEEERKKQEAKAEAKKARKKRRRRIFCLLLAVIVAGSVYAKKTGYEVDWSALIPDAVEERFRIETLNPFADLEIRVIGAAPNIRVELWNNSLNSYMQEVSFAASQTEGLDEGDSIRVVANYDKLDALKAGYRLEPTTMTFTLDEVAHYTQSTTEIEDEVWQAMYAQAADLVEAYIANASLYALSRDVSGNGAWSLSCKHGTPELNRVFFLNQKPGFSEDNYNKCYLIFRIPLTFTTSKNVYFDGYGYFAVCFSDLLDDPDGTTNVTLSTGELAGTPAGDPGDIYDEIIRVHKTEYTVEEIMAEDIAFGNLS